MDKRQEKRERVIKGLECCSSTEECRKQCPYWGDEGVCRTHLEADALALLKAQVEEIKALRQLVEWAEECGFGLDNILWREYVTEEELDSIDGYVEQMIYVARKAVNGNA